MPTTRDAGENDPTPVLPDLSPAIALVKTGDISALSAPPVVGEIITYSFEVTNTGNVTITGVTVNDPELQGVVCVPAAPATLLPGESMVCTGFYELTQVDIDNGSYSNTATATGTDPAGEPVCSLGTIAAGGDTVVTIATTVNSDVTASPLIYTVTAESTTPDPDTVNNSATAETELQTSADVSVAIALSTRFSSSRILPGQ